MIKIIALIDNAVGAGGGFDQALNAIMQMQRLSENRFDFEVFTTEESNVYFLDRLGLKATSIKITKFDCWLAKLSQSSVWHGLQVRFKLIGPLVKKLIKHGCDVVYLVTPSAL